MNTTQKRLADHVIISLNPKAGRTSPSVRAKKLRDLLEQRGWTVELRTDLDEVARRANELHAAKRLRVLVGVGGDGTAAELTNRTVPGTPITLLPSGTANLIAKEFRLPFSAARAANMIETGISLSLDAGRANGRLFLVMVSAGIDADIVERVHRRREECYRMNPQSGGHIGYHSYLSPIFTSIRSYSYPRIEVQVDPIVKGQTEHSASEDKISTAKSSIGKPFAWVFVFNLPRYGWGVPLVPGCVGNDRLLDFCGFRRRGLFSALANVFFAQLGGFHRFLPNAELKTGFRFRMAAAESTGCGGKKTTESPSNEGLRSEIRIPFQLDGDPGGYLPVEIETIPQRLTLLVPEKTAKRYLKAGDEQAARISKEESYVLASTRMDTSDAQSRVLSDHP